MRNPHVIALDLRSSSAGRLDAVLQALAEQCLVLIRDIAGADDEPQRAAVVESAEECRRMLADGAAPEVIESSGGRVVARCRDMILQLEAARAERAREMASLVLMVREVVATVGAEMNTLQTTLRQSTDRVEAIGELTDPRLIKARLVAEVIALKQIAVDRRNAWEATARNFSARVETLETQLSATQSEASLDSLTGVANRRVFDRTCREWITSRRRRFVLCIVDLDDFKTLNDTLGHAAGDEALKFVAKGLAASVRTDDLVARIGGDEFALLVSDITLRQAEFRMSRALAALSTQQAPAGTPEAPSLSCGIAELSAGDTFASLFQRADEALYSAKRQGKRRLVAKPRPFIRDLLRR